MTLREFFKEHSKVALGFSGGVDSTFLLYAALKEGIDIKAYYVKSAFQPEFEFEDAKKLIHQLGAKVQFEVIDVDVLSCKDVTDNPTNRCYYCKNHIFGTILEHAKKDGYYEIIDGTNASDDVNDRPGMRALQELSVYSPLRICGFTKSEIRKQSKEAGLFTWNKPAYACLATRIPANTEIDADILRRVEHAEAVLFENDFTDFRVRVHALNNCDDKRVWMARLELPSNQMEHFMQERSHFMEQLEKIFPYIMLDLKGRGEA